MVVPKGVLAGDIEKMIRQRGGKILESVKLFDIYEGDQVKEGCKSIAYSLSFRDMEKTLSDDEVGAAMKKILNGLQGMNIELRTSLNSRKNMQLKMMLRPEKLQVWNKYP